MSFRNFSPTIVETYQLDEMMQKGKGHSIDSRWEKQKLTFMLELFDLVLLLGL